MVVKTFPDRVIYINGMPFLYFGGTAYLGLPTNKEFQKKIFEGIIKWGTFYGSSRNSNIKLSIYDEAESFFAKQFNTERTLVVSSGTLAGRLVIELFEHKTNKFYHYPKTHPAIISKRSEPLFVNDDLHKDLVNSKEEHIVICCDAVLSGEVKQTQFDFLANININKNITLVIDESHSLGIYDKTISTILDSCIKKNPLKVVTIASLGKSMGISGGIIASDKDVIEAIKEDSLFVSSSCPNASHLYAFLHSQDLINRQKKKLFRNLEFLESKLEKNTCLKFQVPYPVIYSEDNALSDYLIEKGIVISNFKYPNYDGLMNRIVITANHNKNDITALVGLLDQHKK